MPHVVDPTLKSFDAPIYMAIREHHLYHGGSPSQIELRDACLCSITTVIKALRTLEEKGYITRDFNGPRSIMPTDFDLTLSKEPLDAWAELFERRFFKPREWHKER